MKNTKKFENKKLKKKHTGSISKPHESAKSVFARMPTATMM